MDAEVERLENTLGRLTEGFAQYKRQLVQAYDAALTLLSREDQGFSNPKTAELQKEKINLAVQRYFRLRDQIDWWLEHVRRLVTTLTEIERRQA